MNNLYTIEFLNKHNQPTTLEQYKDKIILIVNTASKCGFTPQYTKLEEWHKKYHQQGLVILAFPCNQFMHQEPTDIEQITQFCSLNYGVTFPIMAKIDVNGENTAPLYKYLKKQASGILGSEAIKWNFTKFLINRDGTIINRYAPTVDLNKLEIGIKSLL